MRFATTSITCALVLCLSVCSRAAEASAPPHEDGPAGYTVLAATETGRSLIVEKPNITSIKDAFEVTFPDLANYFHARVAIKSSSQSGKDSKSGIATFSLSLKGKDLRGMVSCKLQEDGVASIAIVYAAADAPSVEWDTLMHPPPPAAAPAPAQPVFTLREYDFPDGTGSIGVADGWTCKTQSAMDPVMITGPANQLVFIGNSKNINTPESSVVKVRQQSEAMAAQTQAQSRRMGLMPYHVAPAEPLLISPICDPVDAVKVMTPQFSALSTFNHGPSIKLDQIISSREASTQLQGAKAADIVFELRYTTNEGTIHFRTQMDLQVVPLGTEAWMWLSKGFSAPVKTFDADQPLMLAMFKSIKLDPDRLQQVAAARNQQIQQFTAEWVRQYQDTMQATADQWQKDQAERNARWQEQHERTLAGYAAHNAQVADALLQRSRNFDDQIEEVRGTVSLYDTQNGHGTTADANDAVDIFDKLYQASMDPNTTVRIPLKDVIDPLPGR
jgi:hypothetical protein